MIDLSALPPPSLIRPLDPEPEIAAFIADLKVRLPEWRGVFESDPFLKVCESWSYRLMLEQQRHNEDARSILLAYAQGADLDHIAATYYAFAGVARAPGETDTSFRSRIQLAPEAYSSAGSQAAYLFHARAVDPVAIIDADVWFPAPGVANVAVQTILDDTDPAAATVLCNKVADRLRQPRLRTSDIVTVSGLSLVNVEVTAVLDVQHGPDAAIIETQARANFAALKAAVERPRRILSISAITAALHVAGVTRVRLDAPLADVRPEPGQRVRVSPFNLIVERRND